MTTIETIERYIIDEIMMGDAQIKLSPSQSLLEGDILDSLAVLRLIGFIEERYRITVDDAEVVPDNFDSLETISNYVDRKRNS